MAEIVRMPKLSDTMTEGVVAEWHKKVGDTVKNGEVLAEIESDKATMEFESFQDGVLLYIGVAKGKTAAVDSILAILGEKGEDISELLKEESGKKSSEPVPQNPKTPSIRNFLKIKICVIYIRKMSRRSRSPRGRRERRDDEKE